jgi:PAS domain S-box-containing protein
MPTRHGSTNERYRRHAKASRRRLLALVAILAAGFCLAVTLFHAVGTAERATPTLSFAKTEHLDLASISLLGTLLFTLAIGIFYTWSNRGQRLRAIEAEALLRDALESISEGFAFFDESDRLVICNEAYRRMHSLSQDAIFAGARFEDVLRAGLAKGQYPDAIGREQEWMAERLRTHRELSAPIEQRMPDGRWLLVSERRTSRGGTAGLRVDITTLKNVQAELRASREHLARAQRIGRMGSDARDLRSDAVEWSDETFRIFGVTRDKFMPTTENFLALVHPDDRPHILARLDRIEAGMQPDPFEYRIIRPDGDLRYVHREVELVLNDAGRPIGFAGTVQDITELRIAQDRQRELEQQLLHSQKLEALGTLAGGVAHDLNNSLVPILALAKLALERLREGDPLREDLATIVQASEHARDLVKQILAFSRREALVRREIDLADVVRDAIPMLRAGLFPTIDLVQEIDHVPALYADAGQLHQVIVNLVTNAAQAIGTAAGRIAVRLRSDNGNIRLQVADTGCGMVADTVERIFEPFFTTKTVGEGTGLGLSVVHGIVAAHGGRIEVSSELGRGTTFTVLFPVVAIDSARAEAIAA